MSPHVKLPEASGRPMQPPWAPLQSAFKSERGEALNMAAYDATMQLWTEPSEPMDLRSRFGSTHLVVCGPKDAPPLVLLHCHWLGLASWAYNIAAFSQRNRVYALDVVGPAVQEHPQSANPESCRVDGVADGFAASAGDRSNRPAGQFNSLNKALDFGLSERRRLQATHSDTQRTV